MDESIDYDDWMMSANTWLALGDKCATHQMYSLATDFYGLGIMKDPDAFRKPMLWLRFAKSCKRCGRAADGQLAVKVFTISLIYVCKKNFSLRCVITLIFHVYSSYSLTQQITASTDVRSFQPATAAHGHVLVSHSH